MKQLSKLYLGDSVYVEVEDDMIKLTTNNGHYDDPRNVIYLGQSEIEMLELYYKRATDLNTSEVINDPRN